MSSSDIVRRVRAAVAASLTASVHALAVATPGPAITLPVSPFLVALGGVYDHPGNPIGPEEFLVGDTGPLLATVSGPAGVTGQFRSGYGTNGLDIQVQGGLDRAVYGGTMWSDGIVAAGAAGVLGFETRVRGDVVGQVELGYALFVSEQPFDLQVVLDTISASSSFAGLQLPNATRVMYTGVANLCGQPGAIGDCGQVPFQNFQGALDVVLSAQVPFVDGQTLYVLAGFESGVDVLGGSSGFLNSADFSVTVPAGVSLSSLSGTDYVVAVPEAPAALLLLCGLAALALPARRRPV